MYVTLQLLFVKLLPSCLYTSLKTWRQFWNFGSFFFFFFLSLISCNFFILTNLNNVGEMMLCPTSEGLMDVKELFYQKILVQAFTSGNTDPFKWWPEMIKFTLVIWMKLQGPWGRGGGVGHKDISIFPLARSSLDQAALQNHSSVIPYLCQQETYDLSEIYFLMHKVWNDKYKSPYKPWGLDELKAKNLAQMQCRRLRFDPWVRKIPWRKE